MKRTRFFQWRQRRRAGSLIVWCAFLLVVLLGMTGLVIDGGMMMASHRHGQNAADAAALAAAMHKMRGFSDAASRAVGVTFVTATDRNNLPDASVTIDIPPTTGPYAGRANYVEARLTAPLQTFFIHALPGVAQQTTVRGRAVAGWEYVAAGQGVIALNPNAKPGLKVSGEAKLHVEGDVYVNSEGGGVDENGQPVATGSNQTAISVSNNAEVVANNVYSVGGVNDPENFENSDSGAGNPLHANSLPTPDPLAYLATPTVANGVVNVSRGSPSASSGSLKLNNSGDSSGSANYIETNPGTGQQTMVLKPGIYDSISITGGNVRFTPGIYVLRPVGNTTYTLSITGGNVTAQGIMFYNTGSNYNATTGLPDSGDLNNPPASPGSVKFGGVKINASMQFSPIDTQQYAYDQPVSDQFDGMLFYQRRWNTAGLQIEGNSSEGNLSGTLYAKWADVKITGQGTYDAQFIVGSLDISGQGQVIINYDGNNIGKAPQIFLVE